MSDETFPRLHYPLTHGLPGGVGVLSGTVEGVSDRGGIRDQWRCDAAIGALVMPSPSLLESRVQASYSELEPASNALL